MLQKFAYRPSDDSYSQSIIRSYESIYERLNPTTTEDFDQLLWDIYKTGYYDGIRDIVEIQRR